MTEAGKVNQKIEFAKFISTHIFQHITSVDQKSSIIIAINGVLLGLLFQSDGLREIALADQGTGVVFKLIVGLLGASAICGLFTIYPKKKPHCTVIFEEKPWRKILGETLKDIKETLEDTKLKHSEQERNDKEKGFERRLNEYKEKFKSTDLYILDQEVINAYILIEALQHQFFRFRWSLILLISAIPLLVGLLVK
jgi:hypothetical protein